MTEVFYEGGASSVDRRVVCPTAGIPCPERQNLVDMYEGAADPVLDEHLPEAFRSKHDGHKLHIKLAEYTVAAKVIDCSGAIDNVCPTREGMNESPVRVGIVKAVRNIIRRTN